MERDGSENRRNDETGEVDSQFSMRRGLRGVRDAATIRFIDKYDELLRYTRVANETAGYAPRGLMNPYTGARLLQGRLGAQQQEAERQYAQILRDQFDAGVTVAEMDQFLTAQHAHERNEYVRTINPLFPDGGSGMTDQDAQNVIDGHTNSGRFDTLEGFANRWRGMLQQSLQLRLANGLITPSFDARKPNARTRPSSQSDCVQSCALRPSRRLGFHS